MSTAPKGSQLEQDQKNAKLFAIVAIVSFIVLHTAAFLLSSAPGHVLMVHPALWIIPVAAIVTLVLVIKAVAGAALWAEESKFPYIILIALSFASAVCVGYNPAA